MTDRTQIRSRRRLRREGMTLVEIMIVVMIMALITAAVGVAVIPKWRQAQSTQARTDASSIRSAVERYMLTNNNADCPSVQTLIEAQEISSSGRTKDPWDNEFRIECQGSEVVVTSGGPDGQIGSEDDVRTGQ